jgi:glycosyltransferase involved in cell wall biosynthesis
MKITCSILCYNYGRYLAQAIESCLDQQPGDYELEILVIDDGSTDETPEVLQLYQGSIRVLRSVNQGFGASLDKSISEASGEYVCLLDADDYFDNNKILTLLPFMKKGYLYIEHTKYFINPDGKVINSTVHGGGNTSTLCLNRAAVLSLLPAQNEIFFHPLKSAGRGVEVDQPLTYYRIHGSSMIRSKSASTWYSHLAKVTHALADRLLSMSQQPPNWVDSNMLKQISREYRAIAYYNRMEAALYCNQSGQVFSACLGILLAAARSREGLTIWHCKVIIRGIILRRPIELKETN